MKLNIMKGFPVLVLLLGASCAFRSEREPDLSSSSDSQTHIRGRKTQQVRRAAKKSSSGDAAILEVKNDEDILGLDLMEDGDDIDSYTSGPKRVFVEFFDETGKAEIVQASSSVIKEYKDSNLMVVEMEEEKLATLLSTNTIKSMQNDEPMTASGSLQEYHVTGRMLEEETPWGIEMVEGNRLPIGSSPVKACIIDTGYDIGHPDLPSDVTGDHRESTSGDFWNWKLDFNGHGTHVAGTIAALGGNGVGVVGVGRVPLHITRGLDDNSGGFESDILDAVDKCVASGAKVINLSLGGGSMSERSRRKYAEVVNDHGVMVVAAAGNQGARRDAYPASHPDVISVVAVYEWGNYWEGSNYGNQVELAAPGHAILSTTTTSTAVHTFDFSFTATQIGGSRTIERTSTLFDCKSGSRVCVRPEGVVGGICLMSRDRTLLKRMIRNCINGGGIGAIIFDANPQSDDDSNHARVAIPVVKVPLGIGEHLHKRYLSTKVSVGFHEQDDPEHTYAYFQGTSMAVPHVVGVAAVVWSHHPTCTNQEIRYALAVTADDQGFAGCDWDYGHGIVKAEAAHAWLLKNPCGSGNVGRPGGGCLLTS